MSGRTMLLTMRRTRSCGWGKTQTKKMDGGMDGTNSLLTPTFYSTSRPYKASKREKTSPCKVIRRWGTLFLPPSHPLTSQTHFTKWDPVRQLLLQREMLLTYQPRTPRNVRQGIPGVPSPSHEGARGQGLTGERKWTSCGTKGWMTRK